MSKILKTMWQRIQTIYLALAVIAHVLLLLGLPIMTAADATVVYARDYTSFFVLIAIAAVDALIAIFLYKNRKLQVLVGRISILTTLVALAILLYNFITVQKSMAHVSNIGLWMPLMFIVFVALANKAIIRDEEKVRSADRIR